MLEAEERVDYSRDSLPFLSRVWNLLFNDHLVAKLLIVIDKLNGVDGDRAWLLDMGSLRYALLALLCCILLLSLFAQ